MSPKKKAKPKGKPSRIERYLKESRDVGRSLALVVPLLLLYEITIPWLAPPVRNSAELAITNFVGLLPPDTVLTLRRVTLAVLVMVTIAWLRREHNSVARPHVMLAEALGHAVLLGPIVGLMVGGVGLSASEGRLHSESPVWLPFVLSIGAGLWEEIVFRLGLLGGLVLILKRGLRMNTLPAVVIAVIVSSLAFALYHHVGNAGEPFTAQRFAFRTFAGTILGSLFVLRGLAIVVYMHVFYDVLCDLRILLT